MSIETDSQHMAEGAIGLDEKRVVKLLHNSLVNVD